MPGALWYFRRRAVFEQGWDTCTKYRILKSWIATTLVFTRPGCAFFFLLRRGVGPLFLLRGNFVFCSFRAGFLQKERFLNRDTYLDKEQPTFKCALNPGWYCPRPFLETSAIESQHWVGTFVNLGIEANRAPPGFSIVKSWIYSDPSDFGPTYDRK